MVMLLMKLNERKNKNYIPEIIKITTTHIYQDCTEDKILYVWLRLFANGLQRLQGTQENKILNPNAETTSQCEKMLFSTRLLLTLVFKIPLSFPDKNTILIQNVSYRGTPLPPP